MVYKRGSSIFFSKKADADIDLWFNFFELMIVFAAGITLWQLVNDESKGTTYDKLYFSRDNAMLVNTLYSSPGDIQYDYPEKTGRLIFDFKQNKIEVYEDYEVQEGGAISYPFAEDKTYPMYYGTIKPIAADKTMLEYSKNKNGVIVNGKDIH